MSKYNLRQAHRDHLVNPNIDADRKWPLKEWVFLVKEYFRWRRYYILRLGRYNEDALGSIRYYEQRLKYLSVKVQAYQP